MLANGTGAVFLKGGEKMGPGDLRSAVLAGSETRAEQCLSQLFQSLVALRQDPSRGFSRECVAGLHRRLAPGRSREDPTAIDATSW